MKNWKKMLVSLLTISLLSGLWTMSALATDKYTYTVTLSAGNKGTIDGKDKIVVDELHAGDSVSFDLSKVTVTDEKYYVKGIRLSGRDNAEVLAAPAFTVTGDEDYVVAYGIKGDQVAYTVHYQDADGNELIPSSTFYGNVGDKPVVAYRYAEGYIPEALAMTKTLSANEAENIFTFVYHPGETGEVTEITTTITTVVPGAAAPGAQAGVAAGDAAAGAGNDGADNAGAGDAAGAGAGDEDADEELEENPDEDTPQGLVDLDDEDTPKDKVTVEKDVEKGMPLVAMIGIIVAAVAGLVILITTLKKRSK